MKVKVAFLQELLCIRGSSVAMYDYADYNEKLLCNESLILLPEEGIKRSDPLGILKFTTRFNVITFRMENLEKILEEQKVDVLYVIKYGKKDNLFSTRVKTVVHCVFDMSEPHGDVYAGVSKEVAEKFNRRLYVPHMIGLIPPSKEEQQVLRFSSRKELNIPEDSIVFGRYGGEDTFNIDFCWEIISLILTERKDVFFLFINTPKRIEHERVKYLDKVITSFEKNKFISMCDAYLECGTMGHSFGLAIGEFSVNNKQIIAYEEKNPKGKFWNDAHLKILKDKGLYYSDPLEFYRILMNFKRSENVDLNCYSDYSPVKVMEIFERVFLC